MSEFEQRLESLKQHILDSTRQSWLFGAGISYNACIPLMIPLTKRVKNLIKKSKDKDNNSIINSLTSELPDDCHIEHYLSHLVDLTALADRSKYKKVDLSKTEFTLKQLQRCHRKIVQFIGDTVRYGYENENNIGEPGNPIIKIDDHLKFVAALKKNKANLERRSTTTFFTTNYDTLLEDALTLNKIIVVDGFSGGAVGFWNALSEFSSQEGKSGSCRLYKLHGSVDWHYDSIQGLVRTRYGTNYLSDAADIMIYPQATKYVETQKDPFAALFSGLRSTISEVSQNVLITCGYSFGDAHINSEIELCLRNPSNKTTVIVFTNEIPDESVVINPIIDKWLQHEAFGNRIYVGGKNGLYYNSLKPLKPESEGELKWWTFSGLTEFIDTGDI